MPVTLRKVVREGVVEKVVVVVVGVSLTRKVERN